MWDSLVVGTDCLVVTTAPAGYQLLDECSTGARAMVRALVLLAEAVRMQDRVAPMKPTWRVSFENVE